MKKLIALGLVVLYFMATSCGSYEDCRSQNTPHQTQSLQTQHEALS